MEIRLLGLVEASQAGRALPLGGVKPRALLAILALQANAPVSADRLIDGLWGEEPPATAHKLVQVLVSQLRKQLAGSDAEILTRGRGYELRMDADAVDALRFERLVTSGENGSHALEALAMWRGPPLDDLADEPFAGPEIRRLEDLWLQAREAATAAALAEGRHAAVLGDLDELVRAHPLRERLHAQRMLALYRSGRQADALEAFRHARHVLLDEVGLEPGPELRRLNDAILAQDPDLDGPPLNRLAAATRRPWRLLVAAAVAIAAAVALAVTQLVGSDGLPRIVEDSAGVIDARSGNIVAQYSVGHAPDAAVAGGGSVWTANGRDGTISRVDRGHDQVFTIDVGGEPTALAFGNGSLWVADGQNGRVDQVDSRTNRVVRRLPAGNAPRGVAVAGGALWVTSAVDGQVERLDLARPSRIQRIDLPGGPAAIAAGAGAVWVAGEDDGVVTKLDAHSGAPLRAFGVGNGPAGIAVGYGGVWVANRDDGTVTRIDAGTEVSETVHVGGRPVAVTAGLGAIWVADAGTDAVIRLDPRTRTAGHRIALGSAPSALAVAGGSLWTAAIASRASHRGGTLHFASGTFAGCECIDPAGYDDRSWPVLSLAYDGLLAYRRIPGAGGSTLVPDLAASIPEPRAGGRVYTFQLRPGLRFSDGMPVRPEDFRASIERMVRLTAGVAPPFFGTILGAERCGPQRCDLGKGIETDAAARTITIRLRRPDAEFPHKLAMPLAYVLPARTPLTMLRRRPSAATGPYVITGFVPGRSVRLERNPRFRSWSAQARPDGLPDAIDVSMSEDPAAQVAAVRRGAADAVVASGVFSGQLPLDQDRALALGDPSHVQIAPGPTTSYLFVNVRARPFDDVRVRRALSYAIDRRRMVELAGGNGLASLSCQVIPPGLPGYVPTCPFTLNPSPGGGWSAPDLVRAHRLIAASGSRGAQVQVAGFPKYEAVTRYAAAVLRDLGYRVSVRVFPDPRSMFNYINDSRHHAQVGFTGWVADFLTPSSFFDPFTCGEFIRNSVDNANISQFCDHGVDADYAAALAARGVEANARWAALDRRVLAASPAIPLFARRTLVVLSDRVGNAPVHPELGPLLDQFWIR
jgi:ABC-type transport system substrate-binding protein/DNA-binding SARP family transcriptional activator